MQDFFVLLQPTHSVRMTSPEVSQDALVRRSGLGLEGLTMYHTNGRCPKSRSADKVCAVKQTRSQDVSNNQYNGRD